MVDKDVIPYDTIEGEIDEQLKQKKERTLVQNEEDIEEVKALIRGRPEDIAVLTVLRQKGDHAKRTPGEINGKPVFQTCVTAACMSRPDNINEPPQIHRMTAVVTTPTTTPAITMKLNAIKKYMTNDDYKKFSTAPRGAITKWAESTWTTTAAAIIDAFHFRQDGFLVGGLLHVKKQVRCDLFNVSGMQCVFIDGFRDEEAPEMQIIWHKNTDGEGPKDFLKRIGELRPKYGLTTGKRDIALRAETESDATRSREWIVVGCPNDWDNATLEELISNTELRDTKITKKMRRGATTTFWLRATAPSKVDSIPICYMNNEKQTECVWATTTRQSKPKQGTVLRDVAAMRNIHNKETLPTEQAPKAKEEPEDGKPDTNMGAETENATDENDKRRKDDQQSATRKRLAIAKRTLPEGMERTIIKSDGDCLYEAAAQAICNCTGNKITAKTMKSAVIATLRKNKDKYEPVWDKKFQDGTKKGDYDAYVDERAGAGAMGSVFELTAIARKFDIRIKVVPTSLLHKNRSCAQER